MNFGIDYISALLLMAAIVAVRRQKFRSVLGWLLILDIAVSSCTIDLSQSSAITPASQTAIPSPVLPQGNSTQQNPNILTPFPTTTIPVTWGDLNLSGKVVYTSANFQGQSILIDIRSLDLTTGVISTIFQTLDGGWVDAAGVSPDTKELVLSYLPAGNAPYGNQKALYIMPLDGSTFPQLLFTPPSLEDNYAQPEWSPDGKYIYFTHFSTQYPNFDIGRMPYPNGAPEKLADNASWPRVSGDSTHLVYVWTDSGTRVNRLYLANADGSDAHQISISGPSAPNIIDAPMFAADDQSILFSAPNLGQSSLPSVFLPLLHVVEIVLDGSIPSDWWSIPLPGGEPAQLTSIQASSLFGDFSPDKKYIAVYSADGIFVMTPDGNGLTSLIDDVGQISGTVSWIP
jgi:Tol biopolymer transport system component